jgi:NADPH:quinone reductase-like Zn-dependent oxidoreductase
VASETSFALAARCDCAGENEELGAGVTGYKIGDRVLAFEDVDVGSADGRQPGCGFGTSSSRMSFGPWNTAARIVVVGAVISWVSSIRTVINASV